MTCVSISNYTGNETEKNILKFLQIKYSQKFPLDSANCLLNSTEFSHTYLLSEIKL